MEFNNKFYKTVLLSLATALILLGVLLFFNPPALFPDPGMGFQVLRCMQLGGGFNNFVGPDQSDISQTYTEFLTWWSPGQYLVPYFFKILAGLNTGQAIAVTVSLCSLLGLAGFYLFFRKIGFTSRIAVISIVFVICQLAFFVPYIYYNGGEILLFSFEGWFLYGCVALAKPNLKLVAFVLLSGWIGFFFKSSFIWIYASGLICLWIRLSSAETGIIRWIKKGIWIAVPAIISLLVIYFSFLSKGRSPASTATGLKVTAETVTFPLASPILSGFSLDDLFHGLIYNFGRPMFSHPISIAILLVIAVASLYLIYSIFSKVPHRSYKLFVLVFYIGAFAFFSMAYLRQLNISYEARHYRIIGILIIPGVIYLVSQSKRIYQALFVLICIGIAGFSFHYLVKGYLINKNLTARGSTGIAQPNIDQAALNAIMKLDKQNNHATFVFLSNDIGLEVMHNHIITLQPIGDDLKIDIDEYRYDGFAGPLYIVLPESYNGPKEKMIMKSFPGYAGFNISMLSDNYVLYHAEKKR